MRWVLVAGGLFVLSGAAAVAREFSSLPVDVAVLSLFVLAALPLAAVAAYRDGGLVVCWVLAFAPAAGPLTVYAWIMSQEGPSPVALPASFDGQGAHAFWIPTALLLGTLAFGLGVLVRWARTGVRAS